MSAEQLELHPSWPALTDRQREAVNEVWDDMVVPAFTRVDEMRRERDEARMGAQDARGLARRTHESAERCAASERERRQELFHRIAELEARVLELECPEMAEGLMS